MRTSKSVIEISKAMHKAQSEMGAAAKGASNPFFKSKYADLNSVIAVIKPVFASNDLCYMQAPVMTDTGAGVTTRIMHVSGEWIESTLILPLSKMDAQACGSAVSYSRRYSLQSLCGIPATDDDGEMAMLRGAEPTPDRKAEHDAAVAANLGSVNAIIEGLANDDMSAAAEAWFELDEETQRALWLAPSRGGCFSTKDRATMKLPEFKLAYTGHSA